MSYKLDDGREVELEYSIEQRGYPGNGWDDAGEPTIVSITEVFDENGDDVELSAAERERLEQEVAAVVDDDDGTDIGDYDG